MAAADVGAVNRVGRASSYLGTKLSRIHAAESWRDGETFCLVPGGEQYEELGSCPFKPVRP